MSVNRTFSDQETAQDLSVLGGDSSVVWWPFAATDWVAADGWGGRLLLFVLVKIFHLRGPERKRGIYSSFWIKRENPRIISQEKHWIQFFFSNGLTDKKQEILGKKQEIGRRRRPLLLKIDFSMEGKCCQKVGGKFQGTFQQGNRWLKSRKFLERARQVGNEIFPEKNYNTGQGQGSVLVEFAFLEIDFELSLRVRFETSTGTESRFQLV